MPFSNFGIVKYGYKLFITADYSWLQLITVNITAENGSLRSIYIMYQLSFCELGLKLAVIRSEQKRDEHPTDQQPDSSAISASSLIGLGWAGLDWLGWAGLGWAGLG